MITVLPTPVLHAKGLLPRVPVDTLLTWIVLVQGVEGDVNAIGYFGYAYYEENADRLKLLNIEGVEAGVENVDNGSYPLARPLFIYSDATIMKEKPQVAAFINFYLTYVNEEITEVGYFPASDEALNQAKQNWLDAMAG